MYQKKIIYFLKFPLPCHLKLFTSQVRFYYFGHGTDTMRLNIYTRNSVYGDLDLVRSLANFDIDSFAYTEELLTVLVDFQVEHPYPVEWISPVFLIIF